MGSFIIKGKKYDAVIIVPKQIENYLKLESILQNIKPITIKKKENLIHKYQSASGFLAVGLSLIRLLLFHVSPWLQLKVREDIG